MVRYGRWPMFAGVAILAGCAGFSKPSPDEYRASFDPGGFYSKKESFSVPKPFKQVMAMSKPLFESCFSGIKAGMPSREVGPSSYQAQVTDKGPGKAEMVYRTNGWISALADIEAAGNQTSVTVIGNFAVPVAKGIKAWTSGDTSCPLVISTPLGVY
jgi:hypothetical protein